jgi:hypothetical protein
MLHRSSSCHGRVAQGVRCCRRHRAGLSRPAAAECASTGGARSIFVSLFVSLLLQVSGSMDRVRMFMQHVAQPADQLVTVVVTLAFASSCPAELCNVRIGCCPGPFTPAVGSTVGELLLFPW